MMDSISFVRKNTKSALILWDEERLLAVPPNLIGLPYRQEPILLVPR
ncbi:hypothetical protein [Paenibacillus dokdonensis]